MTSHPRRSLALVLGLASLLACRGTGPATSFDEDAWRADLGRWRAEYEERLRGPYGWLSLVGLDWIEEGTSVIGSAPESDVRLPEAVSPARLATLVRDGGRVRVLPEPDAGLLIDGAPAGETEVEPTNDAEAPVFGIGDLRFKILRRGERIGVRSRWPQAETRTTFAGVDWYPPDPAYRLVGRLDRSAATEEIAVPTVLGDRESSYSPGRVVFLLHGRSLSLAPMADGPEDRELFFVFRDGTAGDTTYPAGRFLYAEIGDDDTVVLDFNRAYNPPCAWTRFATCPLPPAGNSIDLAVPAGERYAGHHPD